VVAVGGLRRVSWNGERGIVLGWILRIVMGVALAGVLLYEAGAVIVAAIDADTAARSAAQEAASTYARNQDAAAARADADHEASLEGSAVTAFRAGASAAPGQWVVTVTVRKSAKTLFIQHIPGLRRYVVQTASSTAYST
jgi:nitrogen fixation protein FixH